MYQALYRKWRPQTFDQVIGQEHITETLKNQVKSGRLSHAYIFIGTRGTGKTTCARILARAVNCENPENGNPCGKCPSCRGISDGSLMDVVELDAASNNGVDNVRALREEAVFSPAAVKKRVYIIDEVHMLSTAAFNALLKILEEPPAHLLFILATTELQKVPATILSRCQRHSFRRISAERIGEYLKAVAEKEGMGLEPEAAELIARLAEGGVRDALSLLDQCSGTERIDVEAVYSAIGLGGKRRIGQLFGRILDHDQERALKEFSELWMDGKDPADLLGELNSLARDLLMLKVAPRGGLALLAGGYEKELLEGFARRLTNEELICLMETIQRFQSSMRDAKNPKICAELCLVSLCDNSLGESVSALRARVSRLEEQIKGGLLPRHEAAEREDNGPEPRELYDEPPARPRESPEDEEEELELFQEEQPEDAFLQRSRPRDEARELPASEALSWKTIRQSAAKLLPMDVRVNIEDETKISARVEGDVLRIQAAPGFMYGRLNRQEILGCFAQAAKELSGRDMRVQLEELKPDQRQKRSLDELKDIKEVRFI